jgi:Bifunctional DNA primase/polymerase, N-terminal
MTTAWMELRNAALGAIRRGWPVTPGTYLGPEGRWCGRQGATMLGPVWECWQNTQVTDPAHCYETWSEHPYGVLLVCGRGVDVLELPPRSQALLRAPEVPRVPIVAAVRPARWLLLTATGSRVIAGDLVVAKARLHTRGEWVALPPTTTAPFLAPQHWIQPPPRRLTQRLPTADEVQAGLITALRRSRCEAGTG